MINSSSRKAADYTPKQEDKTTSTEATKISKTAAAAAASSSSITSWSRLKDPRIVRVSRAFGGKDRHSKVCTVRGLRDRRVRLSVPTAIQLYDLQDRLNLNQPSKVIDWLLNAAKDDIDKLPPLQMPPADLISQFHLPLISSITTNTSSTSHHHGLIAHDQDHDDSGSAEKSERQLSNIGNWNDPLELSTSNYWSSNSNHMKSKEVVDEEREANDKENWTKIRKQGDDHAYNNSSNNFVARASHQYNPNSLTGLLNNVTPAAHNSSSFLRWDPSNLSLSHHNEQHHPNHNFNFVPILPSTALSIPSGSSHQFVVYPPTAGDFDPKQIINFQTLSSSTSTPQNSPLSNASFSSPPLYPIGQAMIRSPFHLSMNPFGTGAAPNKD